MPSPSRITLTSVKYAGFASQETHCFVATVLFDGLPVCVVENDGRGGSDNVFPLKKQTRTEMEANLAPVKAWIATLPPLEYRGQTFPSDLESVVGDALELWLARSLYLKAIKSKVLYTVPGSDALFEIRLVKVRALTPQQIEKLSQSVLEKHPQATILNRLPVEEAVALYVKFTTAK